jgi:hypothetical protein
MNDDEDEIAIPETGGEELAGAHAPLDSGDVEEEGSVQRGGVTERGAADDIGVEGPVGEKEGGVEDSLPVRAMNGGAVAKRIERPRDPARARGGADDKLLAGVISRIERLESWVKTNRLG